MKKLKNDEIKGHTGCGPHRDKIEIIFNNSDAKELFLQDRRS